jgi:cation transport regulator ChaB
VPTIEANEHILYSPKTDPTKLTTDQILREIAGLKELTFSELDTLNSIIEVINRSILTRPAEIEKLVDHLRGFIETRLNGMDKATVLLQDILNRVPNDVAEKLSSLRVLHEEKFLSVEKQFKERDVRTEQSSKDSKVAVDAALQAAKEAVGEQNKSSALAIAKSEASTMKQIDSLGGQLGTQGKAIDDKFSDMKDRLTRIEGAGDGKVSSDGEHQSHSTFYLAIISVGVAVISMPVSLALVVKVYAH